IIGSDALVFRQNSESPSVSDNFMPLSNKPDNRQSTNNRTNNNYAPSQTTKDNNTFFISSYKVDESRGIIWDIPDGTTIATLKKNIVQGNYTLIFRNKDNTVKTSGKLGTGYTMTVQNGEQIVFVYRISVKAELTGEGNVNSNDIKAMSNYVMRCNDLDELQFVSADLNGDGLVDSQDILLMAEKIHL
ncbi:MAG: dockerin type I repeat-containing protein, partial [Clostridia bacterium]|nr:dockerin type I repeat-containing protein [Clostridia bacterium]